LPSLEAVSDETGIVRFPYVRYGEYAVDLISGRDGENPGESFQVSITVPPGEAVSRTIACPPVPLRTQAVRIRIDWPDDLRQEELWWGLSPNFVERSWGERAWQRWKWRGEISSSEENLLIGPDGVAYSSRNSRFLVGSVWFETQETAPVARQMPDVIDTLLWPDPAYRPRMLTLAAPDTSPIAEALAADETGLLIEYLHGRYDELKQDPAALERAVLQAREQFSRRPKTRRKESSEPWRLFLLSTNTFESGDLDHRLEPGEDGQPATLWITPSDEMLDAARNLIAAIEAETTQLNEAENQPDDE
jgi:hypothetical protein